MKKIDKKNVYTAIAQVKRDFITNNQLCKKFCAFRREEKRGLASALEILEREGKILKLNDKYCTPQQIGAFEGTFDATRQGSAYVIADEKKGDDLFVPARRLNGAMNKDKVLAGVVGGQGIILRVLERRTTQIIGCLQKSGGTFIVIPDNPRLPETVISASSISGAAAGDKVVAKITDFSGRRPRGRIEEVLGRDGDFTVEEIAIIREHGVKLNFPENVVAEAEKVAALPIVLDGRRDLRDEIIITIDGDHTRDIDDGVSIKKDGQNFVLGVHIADVSHYVKRGSDLDKEAYERGTSVYFPDRVCPMLPAALSNGACSLNEGEDRYAMSCYMTFDGKGNRLNYEIFKSVIRSFRRTTYKQIESVINGEKDAEDFSVLQDLVRNMLELTHILEDRRNAAGQINFNLNECEIAVENGEIVIPERERLYSEKMIEQFMVSANEAVAEFLLTNSSPAVFRIHEKPDEIKINNFTEFLKSFGINAHLDSEQVAPADFQKILTFAEDKPYRETVNKVMLRSMQKAKYSDKNLGHFGLASKAYCHFTSPIRRYPDLFVHRAIKCVLENNVKFSEKLKAAAGAESVHLSLCEQKADEAERDVDDLYKVAYMTDKIGRIYPAQISGVTGWGLFAELKCGVECFIPLETLPEESYEFIETRYLLKGTTRSFTLGDGVTIRIDGCDFGRMRVMASLCD